MPSVVDLAIHFSLFWDGAPFEAFDNAMEEARWYDLSRNGTCPTCSGRICATMRLFCSTTAHWRVCKSSKSSTCSSTSRRCSTRQSRRIRRLASHIQPSSPMEEHTEHQDVEQEQGWKLPWMSKLERVSVTGTPCSGHVNCTWTGRDSAYY